MQHSFIWMMCHALGLKQSQQIVFILEQVTTTAGLALITQQLYAQVSILLFISPTPTPHCVCKPYYKHVFCSDTTCVDDTIHLVGGRSVKEGRVQICHNGQWYSICSDNWSDMGAEADVICSTLGYSAELGQKFNVALLQEKHIDSFTTVSVMASFDYESSPILPKDIKCFGYEPTLSNCIFTNYDPNKCQQVAGLICEGLFETRIKGYLLGIMSSHHSSLPFKQCH